MNLQEHAINRARIEYQKNGVINLSLIMELNNMGVDVPALEQQFEEAING